MICLTRMGMPELVIFGQQQKGAELHAPFCLVFVSMPAGQDLYQVKNVLGVWQIDPTVKFTNPQPLLANPEEFAHALEEGQQTPVRLKVML